MRRCSGCRGSTADDPTPARRHIEPVETPHGVARNAGTKLRAESFSYKAEGWERHDELTGMVLGGVKLWLRDSIALRFEARDCITQFESRVPGVDNEAQNDLMLTAGLNFRRPF